MLRIQQSQKFVFNFALMIVLATFTMFATFAMSTRDAEATITGCRQISIGNPHKSSNNPWIDSHGVTDCTGNSTVSYVQVDTDLIRDYVNYVGYGSTSGVKSATSTALKYCPTSGVFSARSYHLVVKNGIANTQWTYSNSNPYLSC